jgi:hypothetical protein
MGNKKVTTALFILFVILLTIVLWMMFSPTLINYLEGL